MEVNKDEALRALAIAQKHRNSGNFVSARRLCQKSINLFDTPEARKLLEVIGSEEGSEASRSTSNSATSTSGAEVHPSAGGTHQRHGPSSTERKSTKPEKRDYTPENAAVVKRVRACKAIEYYEILSLQKDCEENDVKKAYRKVRY